jgi:hypothetical protein
MTTVQVRRISYVCAIATIVLGGCSTISGNIQPSPKKVLDLAATAPACNGTAPVPHCFDNYAYQQMNAIDESYNTYKEELFYGSSGGSLVADLGILGTTLASTATPAASAKATLSAIAAGITGTRTAVDADVLYNNSLVSLIAKMDSDRAQQKVAMLTIIKSTTGYDNFVQLQGDLLSYYESGEIHNAIIGITNSAGAKLSQCSADAQSLQNSNTAPNGCTSSGQSAVAQPPPAPHVAPPPAAPAAPAPAPALPPPPQ